MSASKMPCLIQYNTIQRNATATGHWVLLGLFVIVEHIINTKLSMERVEKQIFNLQEMHVHYLDYGDTNNADHGHEARYSPSVFLNILLVLLLTTLVGKSFHMLILFKKK